MRIITLAAVAAIVAFPVTSYADAKEDAIEARHGYMKMLGMNMGTLSGMAKGEMPYDEAVASTAASNIEALTGYALSGLFIEGTSVDDNSDSEALPAIWEKPEEFSAKYAALVEAAAGAGEAVKGGQANIGPVLQKLGGSCKGCHDDFRKAN